MSRRIDFILKLNFNTTLKLTIVRKLKIFFALLSLNAFFSCKTNEGNVDQRASSKLMEIDVKGLSKAYLAEEISVKEVLQFYVDRTNTIDKQGPELNSIIALHPNIWGRAEELDAELAAGKWRGPLHGIPVLIKDNIDVSGMPTTAGSRAMKDSYPEQSSFLITKLEEAGALIMGKTNLSEWANFRGLNSSSGWSGVGGQTKNPYVLNRTPCGSSSGSGVAIAANLAVLAVGTETNGSIVCPCSVNGIVGIKPTVGLVSRQGIIPISETQDTAGPMTRTLADAVYMLEAMKGRDNRDSKTLNDLAEQDLTEHLKKGGLKGKRIGVYYAREGRYFQMDSLFQSALQTMKSLGAELIDIDEITSSKTSSFSFQVMIHEYKDGLEAYFKSNPNGVESLEALIAFNEKDTIETKFYGQQYLEMAQESGGKNAETYKKALDSLNYYSKSDGLDKVLKAYNLDAIVSPTRSPAWVIDRVSGDSGGYGISSSSYAAWSGYPSITVPMGAIHGLPVGISFFSEAWTEANLIEIAYDYEQSSLKRKPPVFIGNLEF